MQQPVARVRPRDLFCSCMLSDSHERLTALSRRWSAVARRLMRNGHRIDTKAFMVTLGLSGGIEAGDPAAFAVENWHKAHHQHTCQFSGRRNPLSTIDQLSEAQWESPR